LERDKKMDCAHVSELLSPYIDDMLDETQTRALRSHLSVCAVCEEEYAQLTRMREALLNLPEPPLPAAFDLRLRQAVARLSEETRSGADGPAREARARSRRRRRLLSSVAAVFAIGLLSLFAYNRFDAARLDGTGGAGGVAESSAIFAPDGGAPSPNAAQAAGEGEIGANTVSGGAGEQFAAEDRIDYVADANAVSDDAAGDARADTDRPASAETAAERPAAYERHERQDYFTGYPARGTTTSAHRLNEKALCDEILREKLAGREYEILWEEKRDGAWVYRVNLISNETGTRFDQEIEVAVSGNREVRVYYATEFMGF
jgi:anti-sigma factor RsiW